MNLQSITGFTTQCNKHLYGEIKKIQSETFPIKGQKHEEELTHTTSHSHSLHIRSYSGRSSLGPGKGASPKWTEQLKFPFRTSVQTQQAKKKDSATET